MKKSFSSPLLMVDMQSSFHSHVVGSWRLTLQNRSTDIGFPGDTSRLLLGTEIWTQTYWVIACAEYRDRVFSSSPEVVTRSWTCILSDARQISKLSVNIHPLSLFLSLPLLLFFFFILVVKEIMCARPSGLALFVDFEVSINGAGFNSRSGRLWLTNGWERSVSFAHDKVSEFLGGTCYGSRLLPFINSRWQVITIHIPRKSIEVRIEISIIDREQSFAAHGWVIMPRGPLPGPLPNVSFVALPSIYLEDSVSFLFLPFWVYYMHH